MATGAAGGGMFRGVYGGCISSDGMGTQHRPYHCNCSCALHDSGGGRCSHIAKVSYPIRRSWSEGPMVTVKCLASPVSSRLSTSLSRVSNEFGNTCSKSR
ncbi:putative Zinc finger, SWIM-type [Helianthus anomalus]